MANVWSKTDRRPGIGSSDFVDRKQVNMIGGPQFIMISLFFLPTLVVAAVAYWRIKNIQVRICLVLGLLWTSIIFYIDYKDVDALAAFAKARLGHFVTYPVSISENIVMQINQMWPALAGFVGLVLLPLLIFWTSFFVIFIAMLPFYILSLIINRKRVRKENDNQDQEREND